MDRSRLPRLPQAPLARRDLQVLTDPMVPQVQLELQVLMDPMVPQVQLELLAPEVQPARRATQGTQERRWKLDRRMATRIPLRCWI